MKINPTRFDAFVRAPSGTVRAILLHGADEGLVRERAKSLTVAVAGALDDAFRVVEFAADRLNEDPARLADEAAAMSLTGGRRVVRITAVADRHASLIGEFLAAGGRDGDALVIAEAGKLAFRSSLLALFEGAKNALALKCDGDDARALTELIVAVLGEARLTASDAALAYLREHLGVDRQISRRELEKLISYWGDDSSPITLEACRACIGSSAAIAFADVLDAAANGQMAALDRALDRALLAGESPIALLRAAQRHMQRLYAARGRADGEGQDGSPGPSYGRQNNFALQLRRWDRRRIDAALRRLTEAEILCKTTGMPDRAVCRQAFYGIVRLAAA
jgi:DNA polymerase III subunit delta